MFAPHTHLCTACDRHQLIFPSMATAVAAADHGTEVTFTCWCGAAQTAVITDDHSTVVAA